MKKMMTLLCMAAVLVFTGCANDSANNTKEPTQEQQTPAGSDGQSGNAGNGNQTNDGNAQTPTASPSPAAGDNSGDNDSDKPYAEPKEAADAVISALKTKDLATLGKLVHPEHGIRFSPYVHIDAEKAVRFNAGKLPSMEDATVRNWGNYDGSGEPIELTFAEYYDRFVYDHDYAKPQEIGDDSILGSGNTTPNIKDIYPESYIVDYHFNGFDEKNEGMDWASLILVMEEHEGGWYVSAVVHSGWTI
ncbi:hypothetical protein [Paenibacillus soyae]|uniref:Uncharacterized protein n=1 Tax=Paenibacillus soyae TaxID=2969249 RepID=A0A9X2MTC7_9BACL|nr:hypothetical protein [Paenibacillus soyae]MCR2803367.1 hypothetical protein [Paenibacillus soyae]